MRGGEGARSGRGGGRTATTAGFFGGAAQTLGNAAETGAKQSPFVRPKDRGTAPEGGNALPSLAMAQIKYEDFLGRFRPVANHVFPDRGYDGRLFETFGPEVQHVLNQDPKRVWT